MKDTMFTSHQAVLLFFQLLGVCCFFTDNTIEKRSMVVFTGETLELNCNISTKKMLQFSWKKNESMIFYIKGNTSISNLSSRQIVHSDSFTRLSTLNVQPDDDGLYSCTVIRKDGDHTIEWNVTVSEKPEKVFHADWWKYVIIIATGLPLCFIILTVCLCSLPPEYVNKSPTMVRVSYRGYQREEMILTASKLCKQEQTEVPYNRKRL
ncbi:unnamed protein product [Ophioblennius macclurei]